MSEQKRKLWVFLEEKEELKARAERAEARIAELEWERQHLLGLLEIVRGETESAEAELQRTREALAEVVSAGTLLFASLGAYWGFSNGRVAVSGDVLGKLNDALIVAKTALSKAP